MPSEMEPKSEAKGAELESAEQEQMIQLMNYSQRGRMEEQRCTFSPVKARRTNNMIGGKMRHLGEPQVTIPRFNYQEPGIDGHGSTPHISVTESTPERDRRLLSVPDNHLHHGPGSTQAESLEQQELFMNLISNGQRGRMDDQRCSLDPSRSAPCTPNNTRKMDVNSPDADKFFSLLANTQSRRLDDQRVSLPSLPGLQKEQEASTSGSDSSYLCYMVSKVQGSRMEDQRCSLPQTGKQSAPGLCPARSASFNTSSDLERPKIRERPAEKQVFTESDQENFLTILSKTQRGRMDEQRCTLNISPRSTPTHRPTKDLLQKDAHPEKFFSLLVNSQGKRLDDQRISLPSLPGIKTGNSNSNSATEADVGSLCNIVARAQGSRMDDQRCSAPQVLQSSPSPRRKSPSVSDTSEKPQQEMSAADQQQFLKIINHAQSGRMEEQRCSLQPSSAPVSPVRNGNAINNTGQGADSEAFFNIISFTQARRMDDQRFTLPSLPGISGNTEGKAKLLNHFKASPPHVVVAESTPTVSRRDKSNPPTRPPGSCSECGSPRPIPKSASFTPVTEHQRVQNSQAQMTVKVSMSFTPQTGHQNMQHLGPFPEVFLTVGAPGENLVIPLSPVPGRPLSLNLNLVPKEGATCSSNRASPTRACSKPSTPNKKAGNMAREEDCFSVIEKVHTAQLQRKTTPGQRQKKGKVGAKKDKKNSGNK